MNLPNYLEITFTQSNHGYTAKVKDLQIVAHGKTEQELIDGLSRLIKVSFGLEELDGTTIKEQTN